MLFNTHILIKNNSKLPEHVLKYSTVVRLPSEVQRVT